MAGFVGSVLCGYMSAWYLLNLGCAIMISIPPVGFDSASLLPVLELPCNYPQHFFHFAIGVPCDFLLQARARCATEKYL
jgi:hypothetical protein